MNCAEKTHIYSICHRGQRRRGEKEKKKLCLEKEKKKTNSSEILKKQQVFSVFTACSGAAFVKFC